jgi:hypothetical protein
VTLLRNEASYPYLVATSHRLLRASASLLLLLMRLLLLPLLFLLGSSAPPPRIVLPGYFACRSSLLEESGHALVCYAKTQQECRNGSLILAFEKRVSSPPDRARYEIVDTVRVTTAVSSREVDITYCSTVSGKRRQYFVLFKGVPAAQNQYLPQLRRAWSVNAQDHLVEVPVRTLQCLNNDYGAD